MNSRVLAALMACALGFGSLPAAAAEPVAAVAQPAPAASPDATPLPEVAGDLTHLEPTATGDLHVEIASPAENEAEPTLSAMVEVVTGLGQAPELKVNGALVPWKQLGWRQQNPKARTIRYRYYGVPLLAGPNELTASALGAGDLRSAPVMAHVYGPGDPVELSMRVDGKIVADGKTPATLVVGAIDRWGHPAAPGAVIRVAVGSGDATLIVPPEMDANNEIAPMALGGLPSVDVALKTGGTRSIALMPGLVAGEVAVRASLGDLVTRQRVYVAPFVRPAMVVGLASGGAGAVPGIPGASDQVEEGANARRGRIALYVTGGIAAGTTLSAAYDSASGLVHAQSNALELYDPGAMPYRTYGDASIGRNAALSRRHLYLHVDAGRSSLTWGEFNATSGPSDGLSGFNLLVDGERAVLANKTQSLTAFTAKNDLAFARQVFVPTGLGTVIGVLHPSIIAGSESVTLAVLDRHTGAILSQTVLTRNVNYSLDYASGDLRFIDVILPYDLYFNPQEVLVRYEYAGGASASTFGGRYEATVGADPQRSLKLGIGYVNDGYGSGNLTLFGQDLTGSFAGGSYSLQHLTSGGAFPNQFATPGFGGGTQGNAYTGTVTAGKPGDKLTASFDSTSAGYDNPFGGLATPGLLDYRLGYERDVQNGILTLAFGHAQNVGVVGISSESSAEALLRAGIGRSKRLAASAGLKYVANSTGTISEGSSGASSSSGSYPSSIVEPNAVLQSELGLEWKVAPQLTMVARDVADLSGSQSSTNPSEIALEADYATGKNGKLFLRQLWSSAPTSSFAGATQNLTSEVLGKSSTSVGFERDIGSATVTSDYALQQTANGNEVTAGIGVKERWQIAKRVRGDVEYERGSEVGPAGSGFDIYGLSIAYAEPTGHFKSTAAYQLRTGSDAGATLLVGAAGALSPVLSTFSQIDTSRANGFGSVDDRVGLAYRPLSSDRLVSLLEYEAQDGNTGTQPTRTSLLSAEESWEVTRRFVLASRYAYKLDGDAYYAAHSHLLQFRASEGIGSRSDLTVEESTFGIAGTGIAERRAWALEAGLRVGDSMRIAIGDNLSAAFDPTLDYNPPRRGFYLTGTTLIDRILGWGR